MSSVAHFTLEQYELMVSSGTFEGRNHQRVEFIRGEIRETSPIGERHADVVVTLTDWGYNANLLDHVKFRIQSPVPFASVESVPEPDIVWAVRKDYCEQHPGPEDVLLLIEVADTSLQYDTNEKAVLYAKAGIKDYWVINLVGRSIEVFRDPTSTGYRSQNIHRDEAVHPLAFPAVALQPTEVFRR